MSSYVARGRKRRLLIPLVAGLMAVTIPGTVVATHWAADQFRFASVRSTYQTSLDSVRQSTYVDFTSAEQTALRALEAESPAKYYTADSHDLSNNLHATGVYSTNMPNPYYDRDDDNGNFKFDEAEVTVENLSFPGSTTTEYYAFFEYSHWAPIPRVGWVWDAGGGNIEHDAQLSVRSCGVCDKYDAAPLTPQVYGNIAYPSLSPPAGAAVVSAESAPESSVIATAAEPGHVTMRVDEDGELTLNPVLRDGLEAYKRLAVAQVKPLLARGPARGVVTFTKPISDADLASFGATGIQLVALKAIADGAHGLVTVGGPAEPGIVDRLVAMATDAGAIYMGVVAAEVVVPDQAAYTAGAAGEHTYLIDLSVEQVRRWRGNNVDVGMNDLYWYFAGLQ